MLTSRNSTPNSSTFLPYQYTEGRSQLSLLLSRILVGFCGLGTKSEAVCMACPWSLIMNTYGSTTLRSTLPGRTSTVKKLESRYPLECYTACASWYSAMVLTCSSVKYSLSLGEAITIPIFSRPSDSTISSTFLLLLAVSFIQNLLLEQTCSGSQSASTTALMPFLQYGSSAQQPQRKATLSSAICLSCTQQSIKLRICLLFINCTQSTCRYSCRFRVTFSGMQRLHSPRGQGSCWSQEGSRVRRGFLGGWQLGHSLSFGCWQLDRLLSKYQSKAIWAVFAVVV